MNSLDQSSLGDRLPKELEETHLKAVEDVIASQDEEITRIQLEQHKVADGDLNRLKDLDLLQRWRTKFFSHHSAALYSLNIKNKELQILQQETLKLSEKLNSDTKTIESLHVDTQATESKVIQLESSCKDIEAELKHIHDTLHQLDVSSLSEQVKDAASSIAKFATTNIKSMLQKLETFEQRLERFSQELHLASERAVTISDKYQHEVDENKEVHKLLLGSNLQLSLGIKLQANSKKKSEQELMFLLTEMESLQKEIDYLKEQSQDIPTEQSRALELSKQMYLSQLTQSDSIAADLSKEIERTQREINNQRERNSMLESTIQSLQDELSAVHQEIHRMTGLIQDIKLIGQKESTAAVSKAVREGQEKIEKMKREIAALQAENTKTIISIRQLDIKARRKNTQTESIDLVNKMASLQKEIQEKDIHLQSLQSERNILLEQIKALKTMKHIQHSPITTTPQKPELDTLPAEESVSSLPQTTHIRTSDSMESFKYNIDQRGDAVIGDEQELLVDVSRASQSRSDLLNRLEQLQTLSLSLLQDDDGDDELDWNSE